MLKKLKTLLLCSFILFMSFFLQSCSVSRPRNITNVCAIFHQYRSWYWDAQRTQKRWGVPVSVLMAIIYQESRFQSTVKPPRERLLWIIPWKRPTTADGFAQAEYETWWEYQDYTDNFSARRSKFKDAVDFIGWYGYMAHRKLGIPRNNAYRVYLAYHEGIGGYAQGTYRNKRWLRNVAWRVQRRAQIYHAQLVQCAASLQKPWWHIW